MRHHPAATTLAAFIDGNLPAAEVETLTAHIAECAECRMVVTETACFEREENRAAPARAWRSWIAAAAVLAAALITPPLLRHSASPVAGLISAAPSDYRTVEGRLAGFPWARLRSPSRGVESVDTADLQMSGAAGRVLETTKDQDAPESRHAAGLAHLLIGRRTECLAVLEPAAKGSNDPRMWSDLAAARHAVAIRDGRPSELPLALADIDRALRLDPASPEALFNRALILESLRLRDQARQAWQRYLEVDSDSEWSAEAREHLHRIDRKEQAWTRRLRAIADCDGTGGDSCSGLLHHAA